MILGFYGHSNSGKTTIIEGLVRKLKAKGYTVAVIKHTMHRGFQLDSEGTDSWRHRKAGAEAVGLISESEAALLLPRENRLEKVIELVQRASEPDVTFIEGFKHSGIEKVAVGDMEKLPGTVMRCYAKKPLTLRRLEAWVDNRLRMERVLRELPGINCGKCGLNCARLALAVSSGKRRLSDCVNLSDVRLKLSVDGVDVPLGKFPKEMLASGLLGLVRPLKQPGGPKKGKCRIDICVQE
jgi:molybdopterin-guanine dinucleotide biosynthesis protein MobB